MNTFNGTSKNFETEFSSHPRVNGNGSDRLNPHAPVYVPTNFGNGTNGIAVPNGFPIPNEPAVPNGFPIPNGPAVPNGFPIPNESAVPNGFPYDNNLFPANGHIALPPPCPTPGIVPVVYGDKYGRPGTVFYLPYYQIPPSAVPVPARGPNGEEHYVFFFRVHRY